MHSFLFGQKAEGKRRQCEGKLEERLTYLGEVVEAMHIQAHF